MVTNIQKVHTCVNFVKTFKKKLKTSAWKTSKLPGSSASQSSSLRLPSPRRAVLFGRPEAAWSWVEGEVGLFFFSQIIYYSLFFFFFFFACIRFRFCRHYKALVPPPAEWGVGTGAPRGAGRQRPHKSPQRAGLPEGVWFTSGRPSSGPRLPTRLGAQRGGSVN